MRQNTASATPVLPEDDSMTVVVRRTTPRRMASRSM
jgi:hypothetical protein